MIIETTIKDIFNNQKLKKINVFFNFLVYLDDEYEEKGYG